MVKLLDYAEILSAVAKAAGKWCMHINIPYNGRMDEAYKAAPYLLTMGVDGFQCVLDCGGILVFDSEQECDEYYNQTVGDDGPTNTNSYDGPIKIYALTCDPQGKLCKENT